MANPDDWASDANFPPGSNPWNEQPTKVEPPSGVKSRGFLPGTTPPAGWFNWLFNSIIESIKTKPETLQQVYDASIAQGAPTVVVDDASTAARLGVRRETGNVRAQLSAISGFASAGAQVGDSFANAQVQDVAGQTHARVNLAGDVTRVVAYEAGGSVEKPVQLGDTVPAYTLLGTEVITSSKTWTRPDGCRAVKVTCVGGGGGGGYHATLARGGGGAGASCVAFIESPTSPVTVTVGGGGTGGSPGGSPGGAGGESSFGGLVVCGGGTGGATSGGPGGSATASPSGSISARGQRGCGVLGAGDVGGAGGNSLYGLGGQFSSSEGDAGSGYGAGGAGVGPGGANGGSGSPGVVIVESYA